MVRVAFGLMPPDVTRAIGVFMSIGLPALPVKNRHRIFCLNSSPLSFSKHINGTLGTDLVLEAVDPYTALDVAFVGRASHRLCAKQP